jgi:hypothetical protein
VKLTPEPPRPAPATALAAFFAEVSPRLLADVRAAEVLEGADESGVEREWTAVALHACVRGAVTEGAAGDATADLVDNFHDLVLASCAPGDTMPALRAHLAARYAEYDGILRTLGQDGAARAAATLAAAGARHMRPSNRAALSETLAPLLEALAEGAAATLIASAKSEPRLPPIEPLRRLTDRLDEAGLAWAVGASGLLASLGLVAEVNDWDVQVAADPVELQWLFADVPHTFHGHGGCHADWKLAFGDERTELIPRFAFYAPDGVVHVPLHVSGHWRGLPMASPEGWACAYWLMGQFDVPALRVRRAERAGLLLAYLVQHGADPGRVEELLGEPLPPPLAEHLRALARTIHEP